MRTPSRRPGLDRPGESSLQRLNWLTFVKAAPGVVGALSRRVPDSHVRFDTEVASVTCTCNGGLPLLVKPAGSAACECGRVFVNIGREEVRVCRPEEVSGERAA